MTDLEEFEPAPDADVLKDLTDTAEELIGIRDNIASLNETLKSLAEEERNLSQVVLPEKMREAKLESFSLEGGLTVKIEHKVKASLSKARRKEGFAWLRENGFGALIKERVVEESIHHGTLTAFAKEQLREGNPLPECFTVYEFDHTEVK